MNPGIKGVNVGSKIPDLIRRSLITAVRIGGYMSISDFVRDAIKEKLKQDGFLKIGPEGEEDER